MGDQQPMSVTSFPCSRWPNSWPQTSRYVIPFSLLFDRLLYLPLAIPASVWLIHPTYLFPCVQVVIAILDVYSFLDNVRYPMAQVLHRMEYYKYTVHAMLEMLLGKSLSSTFDNADHDSSGPKVRLIQESAALHFKEPYIRDQWRLMALTPQQAVRDAWDRSYNPDMLSPMLCPGLQTLVEEHLGVDFQFGGQDQVCLTLIYLPTYLPR